MKRWILFSLFLAGTRADAGAQTLLHELTGTSTFDFLGISAAGAGDVDGDGHADLIAGALGYNAQGARAIVWSGGSGAVIRTHSVAQIGAVAGLGDLDGDGLAEVAVGDTGDATFGVNTGRVEVRTGASGSLLFALTGAGPSDYFGAAVDAAGDVDNDGVPDLIVGATEPSSSAPGAGYARVHSGASGALLHAFTGVAVGDLFGTAVSGVGDVDADGWDDVAVGAPGEDGLATNAGRVRVYSGRTGAVLHVFSGAAADDGMGRAIDAAGEVNQDGRADVLIGVDGDDTNGSWAGAVRIHSGLDGSVLRTVLGQGAGDRLGEHVAGCGDVDGNGSADFAASASLGGHSVRLFSGSSGSLLFTVQGANLGTQLAGVGDVDGDGFPDVLASDPVVSLPMTPEAGKVFVWSARTPGTATSFCFGDGSGAACPCGNTGSAGLGCANSAFASGALLAASGNASVSLDTLVLSASGMTGTTCVFYQGSAQQAPVVLDDGLGCVAGAIVRLGTQSIAANASSFPQAGDPLISVRGAIPGAGGTYFYQCFYRNAAPLFCTPATSNRTNGVAALWAP